MPRISGPLLATRAQRAHMPFPKDVGWGVGFRVAVAVVVVAVGIVVTAARRVQLQTGSRLAYYRGQRYCR